MQAIRSAWAIFTVCVLSAAFAWPQRSLHAQDAEQEAGEEGTTELPPVDVRPTPQGGGDADQPIYQPEPQFYPDEPPSILEGSMFGTPETTGYGADTTTTGTKIAVPDIAFPGTIDVVTDDLIRDQEAVRFDDVVRNIPAAVQAGDSLRADSIFLRGFEVRLRDFRRNGFVDPSSAPRELINIERIEVLKGPASILYGGGQPSGVVNFITKKPQPYMSNDVEYQFGDFGFNRIVADSTGPVFDDQSVFYRVTTAYHDTDSFRDFGFNERTFVSPAVTFVLDDCTTLTWEGEYQYDRRRFDSGTVALNGDVESVPIERFFGDPGDFQHFRDYRSSFFLTHEINECWTAKVGQYSTWYEAPARATVPFDPLAGTPLETPFPQSLAPGFTPIARSRRVFDPFEENYHSIVADLGGDFCWGGLRHQVVLGTEQGWLVSNDSTIRLSNPATDPLVINGDTGDPLTPTEPIVGGTPLALDFDFTQNRHGFYMQDLVSLNENWQALGGVRYDRVHQKDVRRLDAFGLNSRIDENFDSVVPKVGLIYQPIPEVLSYYATYSESFDPPGGGPYFNPGPFDPETGRQWEGGIKAELLPGLTATVAGFHILKEDVVVDNFTTFTRTQLGELRSQGVEMEALGQLTDRWQLIGNYAYVDTEVTADANPLLVGQPARNVPLNSAGLWTRYNLIQNDCETFGVGLGLVHVGDRSGDVGNSFTLPDYTRWDGGLYYRRGHATANLYVENLFDEQYYTGSESGYSVFPGAPTTVRAGVGLVY